MPKYYPILDNGIPEPKPKEYPRRSGTNPYTPPWKPGDKKMSPSPEAYGRKASQKIQLKLNDKRKGKK